MVSHSILNSHTVAYLRAEISKTNMKNYSKMNKANVINEMLKNKQRFEHITMKSIEKKVVKKPVKKVEVEPVKEPEPIKRRIKIVKKVEVEPEPIKRRIKIVKKVKIAENIEPVKRIKIVKKVNIAENVKPVIKMGFKIENPAEIAEKVEPIKKKLVKSQLAKVKKVLLRAKHGKQNNNKFKPKLHIVSEESEPKKKDSVKSAVPISTPNKIVVNSKSDLFYNELNQSLKGSKRGMNSLVKNYNFTTDEINNVFKGQYYNDFYPTPESCLKSFDRGFKESEKFLEGTAGLGSVVHYINKINKNVDITANEMSKDFVKIIKRFNPDVKITNEDYFNINNLHNYDTIFLNPPFSKSGRSKLAATKDSKYYYNFLFHTIITLNRWNIKNKSNKEYILQFISPPLTSKTDHKHAPILIEEIIGKMGINKLNEILKNANLKELTKKEYKLYIENGAEDNDDLELLQCKQINFLEKCKNFGGTAMEASMYNVII